jgi:pilus assembly protein CpaF
MVNGSGSIFIEKAGEIPKANISFPGGKSLKTAIDRIVSQVGRHIDESLTIVDARFKDGSLVNAVIRFASLNNPVITIRKFFKNKLLTDSLILLGSISKAMIEFLKTSLF